MSVTPKRKRKPAALSRWQRAIEKRLDKLEGKARPIGFAPDDVRGSAVAQHDDDREDTELIELRGRP